MSLLKSKLFAPILIVPKVLRAAHYASLDGIRGIAILMVVLSHFGINVILRPFNLRIDSNIGVHIFFVLSGFLITTLLIKEKLECRKISILNFYKRRALRILPLTYLYLVVLICISIFYIPMSTKLDFLYSFFFLKNLPLPNERFTAHLWTLSVEWQFYIFLPVLLFLSIDYFFVIALFVVSIFPIISILNHSYPSILPQSFPFNYVIKMVNYTFWKGPIILMIGSVAAILTFKGITIFKTSRLNYFLSFFILLLAIIISSKKTLVYHKYMSEYLSAILFALVIVINVQSTNFLSAILNNRLLKKIGVLSFSIYIWQELFIGKWFWIPWLQWINSYPFWVIVLAKLILILPIAYFSYYFLERPFLRMKWRYSPETEGR